MAFYRVPEEALLASLSGYSSQDPTPYPDLEISLSDHGEDLDHGEVDHASTREEPLFLGRLNAKSVEEGGPLFIVSIPHEPVKTSKQAEHGSSGSHGGNSGETDSLEVNSTISTTGADDGFAIGRVNATEEQQGSGEGQCPICLTSRNDASANVCPRGHAAHTLCWLHWQRTCTANELAFTCFMCRDEVDWTRLQPFIFENENEEHESDAAGQ